jgi:hypothetical protein
MSEWGRPQTFPHNVASHCFHDFCHTVKFEEQGQVNSYSSLYSLSEVMSIMMSHSAGMSASFCGHDARENTVYSTGTLPPGVTAKNTFGYTRAMYRGSDREETRGDKRASTEVDDFSGFSSAWFPRHFFEVFSAVDVLDTTSVHPKQWRGREEVACVRRDSVWFMSACCGTLKCSTARRMLPSQCV